MAWIIRAFIDILTDIFDDHVSGRACANGLMAFYMARSTATIDIIAWIYAFIGASRAGTSQVTVIIVDTFNPEASNTFVQRIAAN